MNFLAYFLWAVQNDSERTVSQEEQKILAMLLREHLWAPHEERVQAMRRVEHLRAQPHEELLWIPTLFLHNINLHVTRVTKSDFDTKRTQKHNACIARRKEHTKSATRTNMPRQEHIDMSILSDGELTRLRIIYIYIVKFGLQIAPLPSLCGQSGQHQVCRRPLQGRFPARETLQCEALYRLPRLCPKFSARHYSPESRSKNE